MSEQQEMSGGIAHELMKIQEALLQIRDTMTQMFQNMPMGGGAGGGKGKGNDPLGSMTKGMGKGLKPILGMFTKTIAPLLLLGSLMKGILEPFMQILEPIEAIGEIIGTIFYPILQPLIDKMWEMVDFVSDFMTSIEPIMPILEEISSTVLDFLINVVFDRVKYIYDQVKVWFEFLWGIISDLVAVFKGEISLGEFFSRLWERIKTLVAELWDNVIAYLRGLWDRILDVLGEFGQRMVDWFKGLWDKIVGNVGTAVEKSRDWWEGVGATVENAWDKLWSWV